jgi:signal transduction histidine kinase
MGRGKRSLVLLMMLLLATTDVFGIAYQSESLRNFGAQIEVFSTDSVLTPQQALNTHNFVKQDDAVLNLGVSSQHHWLKFTVSNNNLDQLRLIIAFPTLDEIDFNYFVGDSIVQEKSGISLPFSKREFHYQDFVSKIPQAREVTVLIRIKNGSQVIVPTTISNESNYLKPLMRKDHFIGIYAGFILVMLFYNLFIYISTRDKNYLLYLIYILTVGFAQFVLQGYSFRFLTPESPSLSVLSVYFAGIVSGLSVIFFVRYFLQVKQRAPWFNTALDAFVVLYLICFALLIFGYYNFCYNLINLTASSGVIVLSGVAFHIAWKGYRPARFFVVAWSIFLVSIVLFVLKDFGVVPYNQLTVYSMPIGSAIEVVVLALALADKINILQDENKIARENELLLLKENEKLIREQNTLLERKVAERTLELQISKDNLEETLHTLKNAQSQLVSQEKMASLGQLTAGIAHEINNPINFVSSNVGPLRRDIEDLKEIIDKYDDVTSPEECMEIRAEVEKLKKELDYSYLLVEIDQLLSGIQEGAGRTSEIVKSLKNFSRLDEIESKVADIHEGINSTLVILKSGTKKNVQVVTDFDESIEPFECYPGKLNQVFSNLIVNGIQALTNEDNPTSNPMMTITTKNLDKEVSISIKDNGPGIPKEIQDKIFEPFFTTKDVGEGTGLGLSIVFSIIETHRGSVQVNSEPDKGTEFLITLPKALF